MSKPFKIFLVSFTVLVLIVVAWLIVAKIESDRWEKRFDSDLLRQIGKSLHTYHENLGSFPPGTIPSEKLPPVKRFSWEAELLPWINNDYLYQKLDRTKSWDAKENAPFVNEPIGVYSGNYEPGITRYIGMAGVGLDAPELPVSDPRAGVFGYDRKTKLTEIKDGIEYTMMVLRTDREIGRWAAGGPSTVRGIDTNDKPYLGSKRQFGGTFRGGMNVLFADGSVHWIKNSIDPTTFEALATIAGGEKIDLPLDY